jgi:hypothetical protein
MVIDQKQIIVFIILVEKIIFSWNVHFNETIVGIPIQKYSPSSDNDILRVFLHRNSIFPNNSSFSQTSPIPPLDSLLHIPPNAERSAILYTPPRSPTQTQLEALNHNPLLESPLHLPLVPLPLQRSTRFRHQNVRLDDFILSVTPKDFDICRAK